MSDQNPIAAFAAAIGRGDRAAVRESAAALIASGVAIGDRWQAVAQAMRADGEVALAIAASERWLAGAPGDLGRRFGHADLLARYGRLEAAEAVVRAGMPGGIERHPAACHFVGMIAMQQNRVTEARALLRRAVTLAPMQGRSWHALVQLIGVADGEGADGRAGSGAAAAAGHAGTTDADDVRALLAAGPVVARAGAIDRAAWHSAVGQVRAGQGDHAAAYRGFAAAAALMAAARPYDEAADAAQAERIERSWTATRIAALATPVVEGARPILVCGPPRSGTTLVARILAAHPQVGGGEEANLFTAAAHPTDVADGDAAPDAAARAALSARYRRVLAERFGPAPVLVDKTLSAARYLGLAAAVLPDATLIWVRRDMAEAGWSAFRTFFPEGLAWSWSRATVMRHLAIEERLLAHWQAVLGPRLLVVDHAALVRDPAGETTRMLRHSGLPDAAECLRPEAAAGAVMTASTLQVRRPIGSGAVGAAEPYAALWAADARSVS